MSNEAEKRLISSNLKVIHAYLVNEFPGFDVPPGTPNGSMYHTFTLTNSTTFTSHILRVTGPQLSDSGNTPEKTEKALVRDNVADKMRATKKGEYFSWGYHSMRARD
jgi:hypothetical protein